ncbi:MAG: AAA family ATPase [Rubrivivax sp.]|nr:AAA family ATPase [Rubrivivax sp.]
MPLLVLVRGVPGSGKSTLASNLVALGYRHFEADHFFVVDGRYRYDASRIAQAHEWCREQTVSALRAGQRVVVANTFTRLRELAPYVRLSGDVLVLWARGRWSNLHGVPADVVLRMAQRWEYLPRHRRFAHLDDAAETHSACASIISDGLTHAPRYQCVAGPCRKAFASGPSTALTADDTRPPRPTRGYIA